MLNRKIIYLMLIVIIIATAWFLGKLFMPSETIGLLYSLVGNKQFLSYEEVLEQKFSLQTGTYEYEIELKYSAAMEIDFWIDSQVTLPEYELNGKIKKYTFDIDAEILIDGKVVMSFKSDRFIPISSTINPAERFLILVRFDVTPKCRFYRMFGGKTILRLKFNTIDDLLIKSEGKLVLYTQKIL